MCQPVVLDAGWIDEDAVEIGSWTGHSLDGFRTYDSAKALALPRIAYEDVAVIVVTAHLSQSPLGAGASRASGSADYVDIRSRRFCTGASAPDGESQVPA